MGNQEMHAELLQLLKHGYLKHHSKQSCNKSVCVQENNKEYQILYEAENDNRFATNYPGEETNADYEMDGTQYR
jgi:hypothetical protein